MLIDIFSLMHNESKFISNAKLNNSKYRKTKKSVFFSSFKRLEQFLNF